jgi:uncharacterized repeat protein (TIGR03843 family)
MSGEREAAQPYQPKLSREEMEAAALAGRQIAGKLDVATALRVLAAGELTVVGRLLSASNATFFGMVEEAGPDDRPGIAASCVYKPRRGERPLFDFPDGTLACREVAAHAVSEASGWSVIPPTVMRDGPLGPGMVQLWIEIDEGVDLAELIDRDLPALRKIALLDVVMNNADRKGGHLLPLPDGRILGIDNGLCFATEPKLRTVLWRWRGQPLATEEIAVLEKLRGSLAGELGARLTELLSPAETRAIGRRIDALLASRKFPLPDRNRAVVPWPPF